MNCTKEQIELVIAECQAKSEPGESFRPILDCYYKRVLQFFQAKNTKPEDCDDLTQDVFVRVYRKIGGFRGESAFPTWLLAIAENRLRDYFRRQRRINQREQALSESFNEEHEQFAQDIVDLSLGSNPQERTLDEEFEKNYEDAVNSLPRQMRRCMLFCLQGYTYQQIADLMGLSRGAVSKHLSDARAKIAAYLRRIYGDSLPDEL